MPQEFTHLLNRTVSGVGFSDTETPPGSLSVRLQNISKWSFVEIYGIAWGIKAGADANLDIFDFAELHIIRDEIFRIEQLYRISNMQQQNIVWSDALSRTNAFLYRDFSTPMRLEGSTDYLIVFSSPRAQGAGGTQYDCMLNVRGAIRSYKPQASGASREEGGHELHAGGFS